MWHQFLCDQRCRSYRETGSERTRRHASLGAGQIIWPHGMDVDAEGNIWVADTRLANERELQDNPAARNHG